MATRPKIALIGGGTGSFALLSGLKSLDCDITALVNMVDDGGSTGQLRDEYGVLPPGDVRQCLVALSDAPNSLRNLFNFRFPGDSALSGHSFGNLLLSAVEMMTENFSEAVKLASEILNIKGQVLPVTVEKCQLVLQTANGPITGQQAIEETVLKSGSKPKLSLKPKASLNPQAKQAIKEADLIVIAPGSLYGSIIAALLVEGMPDALKASKGRLVQVTNLVNKPNHTYGFTVSDYISEIERYIGSGVIDYVLYNVDIPTNEILGRYAEENEIPVTVDKVALENASYKAIAGNFLSHSPSKQHKDDKLLKRTLLRHDSRAISAALLDIV